jgi:hypothetical protein
MAIQWYYFKYDLKSSSFTASVVYCMNCVKWKNSSKALPPLHLNVLHSDPLNGLKKACNGLSAWTFFFLLLCLSYFDPFLPTNFRCRELLFHVITSNDTQSRARTHTHTHYSLGMTVLNEWSALCRDRYLTIHNTLNKIHQCPRRDSNPQSQQASGRRSTPQIMRLPGSAA